MSQALSYDAAHQIFGALYIVHAQRDAVVIAEIKLSKIAMQVLFCTVLIGALHAAFEHRKHAFDGVSGVTSPRAYSKVE